MWDVKIDKQSNLAYIESVLQKRPSVLAVGDPMLLTSSYNKQHE